MNKYITVLFACIAMSFANDNIKPTIWLVGDSTMSIKEKTAYPETGWGMPFAVFFDSNVVINNVAQNGRSTSSFKAEGRWKTVMDNLKSGDYVLIQFGHNDEVITKKTYTTPEEFTNNLDGFVKDVRSKNATPILLTPVARRNFDSSTGNVIDTHVAYAQLVRDVAKKDNVTLIDLDVKSMELLQQTGAANSVFFFNHLKAGEHPNYPNGKEDNTHFNELGARKMAELVLHDIQQQQLSLAKYIVTGNK